MLVFSITLIKIHEHPHLFSLKVYYSIEDIPVINNPVLTLGTFDGVHLGHQEIIALLKESASKINGETVLFTFHPHPRIVLHPDDHGMKLIQSIDERIKKLEAFGIDHLILFPFSVDFSRLSATEFVRDILVNKINVQLMTIGYNHHFGRNREGNIALLRELAAVYDFDVQEIPAFSKEDINISSTKIRDAIEAGEISKANDFMGDYFEFEGIVQKGDQIGTKIGFPTANIEMTCKNQVIPVNGVYAVSVEFEGNTYQGMMNIGTRPTISLSNENRIEVHIFNFNQMIYGRDLRIKIYDRIRSEQTFGSLENLKEQLEHDKKASLIILDKHIVGD